MSIIETSPKEILDYDKMVAEWLAKDKPVNLAKVGYAGLISACNQGSCFSVAWNSKKRTIVDGMTANLFVQGDELLRDDVKAKVDAKLRNPEKGKAIMLRLVDVLYGMAK